MDERMLRHALMEANLERFRGVLDAAEEPDWSHRYLRNRTRLLADPFGWAKRMARPVWKRAARTAACVLLACLVTLGGLMAVSPAVRAAVLGWFCLLYTSPRRRPPAAGPTGCPRPHPGSPSAWRTAPAPSRRWRWRRGC